MSAITLSKTKARQLQADILIRDKVNLELLGLKGILGACRAAALHSIHHEIPDDAIPDALYAAAEKVDNIQALLDGVGGRQ